MAPNLSNLPTELVFEMLSHLEPVHLFLNVRSVNQRLRDCVETFFCTEILPNIEAEFSVEYSGGDDYWPELYGDDDPTVHLTSEFVEVDRATEIAKFYVWFGDPERYEEMATIRLQHATRDGDEDIKMMLNLPETFGFDLVSKRWHACAVYREEPERDIIELEWKKMIGMCASLALAPDDIADYDAATLDEVGTTHENDTSDPTARLHGTHQTSCSGL